ncbi:HEXXH motif-containing putative peptide modification protein [Lentzea sp. NPDC006480]|uniref:aKG-HExxH-type peptide beta-hydroxylase n=1 Tax=Lentzea sp. NPDC006480 TaxID=3157176 RepID=UPI0033B2DE4E
MTATLEMRPEMFTELACGRGGAAAARFLLGARRSRTLLLLHAVAAGDPAFAQLRKLPAAAVRPVLDHPRVGAWALRTALTGTDAGELAAVLAAARVRAQVSGVVEVPGGRPVVLPSVGTFHPAGDGPVRVVTGEDGCHVSDGEVSCDLSGPPTPHWKPLRRWRAEHDGLRLTLAIDDLPERLPDHVVAASDLQERRWQRCLRTSWQLLVEHHRPVAEEIAATLSVLTPLSTTLPGHASVTFANALGCVAMSLPDDPRVMAVAFAHEVQHAKLSALLDLFPLVDRASRARLHVGWRPDPRPPVAVLHGAYAHLAVAAFWRHHPDAVARVEFVRWSSATRAAVGSLESSGALTDRGRAFVGHMRRRLDSLIQ